MNIMLVSVDGAHREIGLRKAVRHARANSRAILLEACTDVLGGVTAFLSPSFLTWGDPAMPSTASSTKRNHEATFSWQISRWW